MKAGIDRENLHLLADESLVSLAVESQYPPAANILILRHYPWISAWIAARGRALRLSVQDVEDAVQRAVCVLLEEVIPRYHQRRLADSSFRPFREFLVCVEATRFKDFVRRLRRESNHFERPFELAVLVSPARLFGRWTVSKGNGHADDSNPLTQVLRQEFLMRLGKFLGELTEPERQLWNLIVLQHSQVEMAATMRLPYITVRRMRRRLLEKLARFLNKHFPLPGEWGLGRKRGD